MKSRSGPGASENCMSPIVCSTLNTRCQEHGATRSLRIAFLTPEFRTECLDGGLASYLDRMTRALRSLGHECEVFVESSCTPEVLTYNGMRVQRVRAAHRHWGVRGAFRLARTLRLREIGPVIAAASGALGLSQALEQRHEQRPFDIVQSADTRATGLFVRKCRGRRHLVRCSWARTLCAGLNGHPQTSQERYLCALERRCIRTADAAYAPSEFVAGHYRERYGLDVQVLRPPVNIEVAPAEKLPWTLPTRFFLHFGQLIKLKGTAVLSDALREVWKREPGFTMVWAGEVYDPSTIDAWSQSWGDKRSQVVLLGVIEKPLLYAVLQRAEAAVLPSLLDNLPNTVIESQLFGIPVIGTRGASIDELVEDGVNGELVAAGDVRALAEALIRAWRGETRWIHGHVQPSPILQQMKPEDAARNLLHLAGFS